MGSIYKKLPTDIQERIDGELRPHWINLFQDKIIYDNSWRVKYLVKSRIDDLGRERLCHYYNHNSEFGETLQIGRFGMQDDLLVGELMEVDHTLIFNWFFEMIKPYKNHYWCCDCLKMCDRDVCSELQIHHHDVMDTIDDLIENGIADGEHPEDVLYHILLPLDDWCSKNCKNVLDFMRLCKKLDLNPMIIMDLFLTTEYYNNSPIDLVLEEDGYTFNYPLLFYVFMENWVKWWLLAGYFQFHPMILV